MRAKTVILVAEDDPCDALLLKLAFKRAEQQVEIHFVQNGEEAMAYLSNQPPFQDRTRNPWPDVLLLDLNMPRVDGYDVLEWLKCQAQHGNLSVGVLSGMEDQESIGRALDLGASFYLVKPHDPSELAGLAAEIAVQDRDRVEPNSEIVGVF